MNRPVTVQRTEGIAVLTVDNPPANALSVRTRAALAEAIAAAETDGEIRAIVIAGRGKGFAASADLRELDREEESPTLGDLCRAVERSTTPVVAALHGAVLGAGLELALAAHYRIADRRAQFGFPEIALGLCPGGGGTQRLPRLVGPGPAADLILSGRRLDAATAEKAGLVDLVAEGPLPVFTLKHVLREVRGGRLPPRPTGGRQDRLKPERAHLDALGKRREAVARAPLPAPGKALDCVEAAILLPFEAGLSFERAAFDDLAASPESRALRHAFIAEKRAARPPLESATEPGRIASVGVVGMGLMGTGIAAACLDAGLSVTAVDASVERLEAGVENVIDIYDRKLERKRIDAATRDARIARLSGQSELAALADADIVIDASTEDAEIKRRVFAGLDAVMKRDAILATTTSGIDIDGLAAGTGRPEAVVGLHFVPPAHVIRLCEVVVAVETSDRVIATAFAFARRLGKQPVASGVGDGYIAGRVQGAFAHAAELCVAEGAGIEAVDDAMREIGFPMGPFEMADLAGIDVDLARRARHARSAPGIAERLIGLGRFGRRLGRGYYHYAPDARRGALDDEVTALLSELRALSGRPTRELSAEEIRRRCLAAMANEGARLVEEGIAARPSDIDVAMIAGYGFPRHRGGPMMAADLTGLLRVKRDLDRYAEGGAEFWAPAPLFAELIKYGKSFADMNG